MRTGDFRVKNDDSFIWTGGKFRELTDRYDFISLMIDNGHTASDILYVRLGTDWMTWPAAAPYFIKYDEYDRPSDIVIGGTDFVVVNDDHCCSHWVYVALIEPKHEHMRDFFYYKANLDKHGLDKARLAKDVECQ